MENIKERLSLAQRSNSGLQSQLVQKTEMLTAKSEELYELKKGKRFAEDGLSSSHEELREKKTALASLNDRVSR